MGSVRYSAESKIHLSDQTSKQRGLGAKPWWLAALGGVVIGAVVLGGLEFLLHPIRHSPLYESLHSYLAPYLIHVFIAVLASLLVALIVLRIAQRAHKQLARRESELYSSLQTAYSGTIRELTQSRALLECLFNAIGERILVLDRTGKIVLANQTAIDWAGKNPEGHLLTEVFPVSAGPGIERRNETNYIQHCFEYCHTGCVLCRGRLIRCGPNGQRLLSVDVYPIAGVNSETELVVEVARDVTRQKELEIQHKHQEKMATLGVLVAGLAHDLSNPLASLHSELEMMRRKECSGHTSRSLGVLEKHLNRISRMLRRMVEFASHRGDTDGADVCEAVNDARRLVEHDPRARNIDVLMHIAPRSLPGVGFSGDDLVLIVINLLLNAFDAMPNGGRVWITATYQPGSQVSITIRDTGMGMTDDILKNATKPMFTTKGLRGGTGLGLSVSADMLRAAGGGLELASRPGRGTRVTLKLPVSQSSIEGVASTPFQSRG